MYFFPCFPPFSLWREYPSIHFYSLSGVRSFHLFVRREISIKLKPNNDYQLITLQFLFVHSCVLFLMYFPVYIYIDNYYSLFSIYFFPLYFFLCVVNVHKAELGNFIILIVLRVYNHFIYFMLIHCSCFFLFLLTFLFLLVLFSMGI